MYAPKYLKKTIQTNTDVSVMTQPKSVSLQLFDSRHYIMKLSVCIYPNISRNTSHPALKQTPKFRYISRLGPFFYL